MERQRDRQRDREAVKKLFVCGTYPENCPFLIFQFCGVWVFEV